MMATYLGSAPDAARPYSPLPPFTRGARSGLPLGGRTPAPSQPLAIPRASHECLAPAMPATILLVDDEVNIRLLVREVLALSGYRVLEAGSGDEALRLSDSHPGPIDVLLTDVVMPGINGHELALRSALARPEMKVLYMSGYTADALPAEVLEAGHAFIRKPFGLDALTRKLRELLET